MKTLIYVIRHGYTESNDRDYFSGQIDVNLAAEGRVQAEKCAEFFKDIHLDAIYASDLRRAVDTATPLARAKSLEVLTDPGLREINGGKWEGVDYAKLGDDHPNEAKVWFNDMVNARCPDGESIRELSERVKAAFMRIGEENKGKTVCVVSHATPIRAITTYAQFGSIENLRDSRWASNASVSLLEYENGRFSMRFFDSTDHLGGHKTKPLSNV